MKSTICSILLQASSVFVFMSAGTFSSRACGPYTPLIPTPEFFQSSWTTGMTKKDFEKEENLCLWQRLTSAKIPLEDIEEAVYRDKASKLAAILNDSQQKTTNLFYLYLRRTNDKEIGDFLLHAKSLEERRAEFISPWYYPSSRHTAETGDFQMLIDTFKSYQGERLRDRYALQIVRALFASRQYDKCVEYYDSAFVSFPDANLFKRMAMDYVAGCWSRLGDTDKANEYFARTGNLLSLKMDNPFEYMVNVNPDCPELFQYVQDCSDDSAKMCALKPFVEKIIQTAKVKYYGNWEFALAYIAGEHHKNYKEASLHIKKSLQLLFSSDELRDHAYAYKMKCDAALGDSKTLLSDLQWLEGKMDLSLEELKLSWFQCHWYRTLQHIVYMHWVPVLWKKKDYATAILLCGYVDNKRPFNMWHGFNAYSSLSFQLMGSLTSSQLIDVKRQIHTGDMLFRYLKKYARIDSDYWDELIGTLALREEDYATAMAYLASVSEEYQKTMHIYNYLQRDPFFAYPYRWYEKVQKYGDYKYIYACEHVSIRKLLPDSRNAKLRFASQMYRYQMEMKSGKNAEERGLARLKYAIGRRNAFEECWALTQYWRGESVPTLFIPRLAWGDICLSDVYDFLFDYEKSIGHLKVNEMYNKEIKAAMAMLQSDEAKAEAEYMFFNVKTIIKRYPNTSTAYLIRTSCDDWSSWL